MLYRSFVFLLIGILASGCIGWTSISEVPEKSEDYRSQVIRGQTSRDAAHKRLGDPFISVEKIEVYRVQEDPDVSVMIPVWKTQEVILYALVVYDDNDIVEDIDWGIYPHEKEDDSSVHVSAFRSARLQASNYHFAAFKRIAGPSRRQEVLVAPHSISHHAFEIPPPSGMCSAIVYLKPMEDGSPYERELYLDGEHVAMMPLTSDYGDLSSDGNWSPYRKRVFIKLLVTEGLHELSITARHSPTEFRRKFECLGGNVFYVYPRHKVVESEPWSVWRKTFKIEGSIEIYDQPIESDDGWRRLLFYGGKLYDRD